MGMYDPEYVRPQDVVPELERCAEAEDEDMLSGVAGAESMQHTEMGEAPAPLPSHPRVPRDPKVPKTIRASQTMPLLTSVKAQSSIPSTSVEKAVELFLGGPTPRVLNVQSPWAELLVYGYKTAEFRPVKTTSVPRKEEWILIISSGNTASGDSMLLAQQDFLRDSGSFGTTTEASRLFNEFEKAFYKKWPQQAAVGLIQIAQVKENPTHPWMHTDDKGKVFAWEVGDAVVFPQTIPNIQGTLSLRGLHTIHNWTEIAETMRSF